MQGTQEKIEQTLYLMLMLWALFMIALYACSFLAEYHFPGTQEETLPGEKMLEDLQKVFFFALMGMGFLIDLVRIRQDRGQAFLFLVLSLAVGGFAGGVGALQYRALA
ncbi:MAG: hypothetical protein QGG48_13875, partial [Desulfatiglandales bacterium]|nr:hypothetical protein [Desulfatiglandales bacterium]